MANNKKQPSVGTQKITPKKQVAKQHQLNILNNPSGLLQPKLKEKIKNIGVVRQDCEDVMAVVNERTAPRNRLDKDGIRQLCKKMMAIQNKYKDDKDTAADINEQ